MGTSKTSKRFIIIVIALIAGTVLYTQVFYSTMRERVLSMLSEISYQSGVVLQKEIEKEQAVLNNIASYLAQDDLNVEQILHRLETLNHTNLFKRMGIIDLDGNGYTTDGLTLDMRDRESYREGLLGHDSLSATIEDKVDGKEINVFSTPIIKNDEVIAILFATYSTDYYRNLFSNTIFNGQGYTYVVDKNGDCVIYSNNKNSVRISNIYETLGENENNSEALIKLHDAIDHYKSGHLTYFYKVEKYMDYRPLDWNDWYVLTIIPEDIIADSTNALMFLSVSFAFACVASISYLVVYIYRQKEKNKREQEEMIFVDPLTKGRSQAKFKLDIGNIVVHKEEKYAIVIMDIEKFKYINDLYGFHEGDQVLKDIYQVLLKEINRDELCARQTGDHFILLLRFENRSDFTRRLEKLREKLLHCHQFGHQDYEIRAKFGVCLIAEESQMELVIDHADLALNLIKKEAMKKISYYDDQLKEQLLQVRLIENKFQAAITNKEFIIYYQPKFNLTTNEFDGSEALVRWIDDKGQFIMPNHFIPIFENNGTIIKLDAYVFNEVCSYLRKWLDEGLSVGPISINVSRLDLYSPAFVEDYIGMIKAHKIPPELIQLEITETALFDNNESMLKIINQLHEQGIQILMDDFGTGYSSVSMIKDIPIDGLKIDKSLIDDLLTNDRSRKIIKMILDLCHQFDIYVIAEGVETLEQFNVLKELGCDYIQGYYCAKPMNEIDYLKLTKET